MRRRKRHPVLEAAVFAAALLLAAFIGRELWKRRAPVPEPASSAPSAPAVVTATFVPAVPSEAPARRTETGVTGVPSMKLTRLQRGRQKAAVPAPK